MVVAFSQYGPVDSGNAEISNSQQNWTAVMKVKTLKSKQVIFHRLGLGIGEYTSQILHMVNSWAADSR